MPSLATGRPDLEPRPRRRRGHRTEESQLADAAAERLGEEVTRRAFAAADTGGESQLAVHPAAGDPSTLDRHERDEAPSVERSELGLAHDRHPQLARAVDLRDDRWTDVVPRLERLGDGSERRPSLHEPARFHLVEAPANGALLDRDGIVDELEAAAAKKAGVAAPDVAFGGEGEVDAQTRRVDHRAQTARRIARAARGLDRIELGGGGVVPLPDHTAGLPPYRRLAHRECEEAPVVAR